MILCILVYASFNPLPAIWLIFPPLLISLRHLYLLHNYLQSMNWVKMAKLTVFIPCFSVYTFIDIEHFTSGVGKV